MRVISLGPWDWEVGRITHLPIVTTALTGTFEPRRICALVAIGIGPQGLRTVVAARRAPPGIGDHWRRAGEIRIITWDPSIAFGASWPGTTTREQPEKLRHHRHAIRNARPGWVRGGSTKQNLAAERGILCVRRQGWRHCQHRGSGACDRISTQRKDQKHVETRPAPKRSICCVDFNTLFIAYRLKEITATPERWSP